MTEKSPYISLSTYRHEDKFSLISCLIRQVFGVYYSEGSLCSHVVLQQCEVGELHSTGMHK